ncbi:MAG: response regulator transcription factor [Clostridium sp.]
MINILIVEDDFNTRKLFNAVIKGAGYMTYTAEDGVIALEIMEEEHIDLIILDVMMGKMDGYELTKTLRDAGFNLPILMVSAKQLPVDKRKGFLVGTDDYMTKPIDEEEMLLRIRALLRRAQIATDRKIVIGNITLNYDELTVTRFEEKIVLPQKEFLLLFKLLSYPDKIFTRAQLMDEIWGMDSETTDSTLNVHINRLRKRFEEYDEFELVAVRGLGYKGVRK